MADTELHALHPHAPERLTLEETAIDACSRKRHAVSRGYFADPYLKYFTRDSTYLNSPLMNRGYWLRVRAVESAINRFVAQLPTPDTPFQVLSIGGGFDTTFFRWAGLATEADSEPAAKPASPSDAEATQHEIAEYALGPASMAGVALRKGRLHRYVDLDHTDVIVAKKHVIERHQDLAALASMQSGQRHDEPIKKMGDSSKADVLRLVGADLRKMEEVAKLLTAQPSAETCSGGDSREVPIFGMPPSTPILDPNMSTLVIAECVLVYMRPAESLAVLEGLMKLFSKAPSLAVLSYDAIRPTTPFGKQMVHSLGERGLQLRGIEALPDSEAHKKRYKELGFPAVEVWTMKELFEQVPGPVQRRLNHVEIMDDYDEWCLVQEHYCMSWALRTAHEEKTEADDKAAAKHVPPLFF